MQYVGISQQRQLIQIKKQAVELLGFSTESVVHGGTAFTFVHSLKFSGKDLYRTSVTLCTIIRWPRYFGWWSRENFLYNIQVSAQIEICPNAGNMCFSRIIWCMHDHNSRYVWVGSAVLLDQNLKYCFYYGMVGRHVIILLFFSWAQMILPPENLLHLQMCALFSPSKGVMQYGLKVCEPWCPLFQPCMVIHYDSCVWFQLSGMRPCGW